MSDAESYLEEYADAAGLRRTDMPNSHHPLLENNDDIESLSDLVQVRSRHAIEDLQDPILSNVAGDDLDVSDALTFPHTGSHAADTPVITDYDADARTHSPADDADDRSYMTRQDVVEAMNETDPAPDAGADEDEYPGGIRDLDHAPLLEGTVAGVIRGTSTHLPLDLGADGFQIVDPDRDQEGKTPTSRVSDRKEVGIRDAGGAFGEENLNDGDRIPMAEPNIDEADDALDATRRLR